MMFNEKFNGTPRVHYIRVALHFAVLPTDKTWPSMALPSTRPVYRSAPTVKLISSPLQTADDGNRFATGVECAGDHLEALAKFQLALRKPPRALHLCRDDPEIGGAA